MTVKESNAAMNHTTMYWLHVLSPTHVGTGRGVGYIDLPIHRDKVTGWPLIPGSAFKGVWAAHFHATDEARRTDAKLGLAFGRASDHETNASNAGALIPTDARLVCLPIRSFHGTFAWCTSALALQLLCRDLALAGAAKPPDAPPPVSDESVQWTDATKLADGKRVYLEDLDFAGAASKSATAWASYLASEVFSGSANGAWRDRFAERFAIVPDSIFDFFSETGTEVVTRVRIDEETRTVKDRQLWTEEALPAETILAGMVACDRVFASAPNTTTPSELVRAYATDPLALQLGGKATIGRGRVQCVFTRGAKQP
jgi:CRISPR-associated protein Cmr4